MQLHNVLGWPKSLLHKVLQKNLNQHFGCVCVCVCVCVFFCRCFSIIGYYQILNIISVQLTRMVSSNHDHSRIKYQPLVEAAGVTTKARCALSLHWVTGGKGVR